MSFRIIASITAIQLVGCASITNDAGHPIKIDTKTTTGEFVTGADCKITNEYGSLRIKSGETAQVRRSNRDLEIVCRHPNNLDAYARAISRANAGMWGNIIVGGAVGAVVDHTGGAAYTYPSWMQLVFGKTIVFDRRGEKEGLPTMGTEIVDK